MKPFADAELDLNQLRHWHEFCADKGLFFNKVFEETETTIRDVLVEVASAGRATPRHDGLKWGVTIDRPQELVVDHLTPRNSDSFKIERASPDIPDGYKVTFRDEKNDYKEATL